MFRKFLVSARREGRAELEHIDQAMAEPNIEPAVVHAGEALEAAWRMEAALGEMLSIDEKQARVTGFYEAQQQAHRAFNLLRTRLSTAEHNLASTAAEMKDYLAALRADTEKALQMVEEALSQVPAALAWREVPQFGVRGRRAPAGRKATVSIARRANGHLSQREVKELVTEALQPLGGIEAFVKPGQSVLIKPNLTLFFLAEEGVSTAPALVAALVALAYDAGASKVLVGESSGGGTHTLEALNVTGIADLAKRAGAELVDFHTCEQRVVQIPESKLIESIAMPVPLLEADVVINAPKAKTHNYDLISCCLKNWVGTLRPDVRSAHHDWDTVQTYCDLMKAVRPTLNVVDALYIGEGNGPGATSGLRYGGIIAGTDPVATDAVVAGLMGFNPGYVTFIQTAQADGLGVADPARITIEGVPFAEARVEVRPCQIGVEDYEANVIVGSGVSRPGTLGHFKSTGDIWQMMDVWGAINRLKGRPTIMLGLAEDPFFETHLQEGPYLVIDDAAADKYKNDPRVAFIPGHPVLHNMLPQMMLGLGVPTFGNLTFGLMAKLRRAESTLEYARVPVAPLAAIPATVRRLPVMAQYATLGSLAALITAGIAFGAWMSIPRRRKR